jgi:hypothetical protein
MPASITTSKRARKAISGKPTALAVHASHDDGEHHAVVIWNLSVLIVPDEKFGFAQGLEINYGAQGSSPEDAQERFQEGLSKTIHQHLKVHGNIEKLLKFAPSRILREAAQYKSSIRPFAQVSFHEVLDDGARQAIPFDGIDYRVLQEAA